MILRMYNMGMRTSAIAQVVALDEEQVVAALTKSSGRGGGAGGAQRGSSDGDASGAAGGAAGGDGSAASDQAVDGEAQSLLVTRLLTDPDELCCPITSSLMADPVVAEDGNTYERRAIEMELSKKEVSPITGQTMGNQLLPTQAIRAQVADHRESTVREILAVVPCVGPTDAANLLRRAESLVRPRLPEAKARRLLGEVLLMRSRLHGSLTGEDQSLLVSGLLTDPVELCCPITTVLLEDPVVAEDGNTYERRAIELELSKKEESPITGQTMGKQLLPTQAIRAQVADHRESTVRQILAIVPCVGSKDAADLLRRAESFVRPRLPETKSQRLLGDILLMRSRLPGSLTGEALSELVEVLANGKDDSQLVELMSRKDDNSLSKLLYSMDDSTISKLHKIACARCPSAPVKSSLDREYTCRLAQLAAANCARATDMLEVCSELAKVLYQICHKQNGVQASMEELADCKEADGIISRLARLLSDAVGREDVDEALVLRMLSGVNSRISDDVARRLRLRKEEMQQLPPALLMKVSRQLSRVERFEEAAILAVIAANKHQDAGQEDEAHNAFRLAYDLDSKNTDAAKGIMALCSAATQTSKQLQVQVKEMSTQVQQQNRKIQDLEQLLQGMLTTEASKNSLLSWDISMLSVASMTPGKMVESYSFKLLGSVAEATLLFYPKGCGQFRHPQVLLKCSHRAEIDFTISCDLISRRATRSFSSTSPTKGFDFPQKDKYSTVTLIVHAISFTLKNGTMMHMKGATTTAAHAVACG